MGHNNFSKLDPEIAFVWYLMDKKFKKLNHSLTGDIDWKDFNWKKALAYARRNFVSYQFSSVVLEGWRKYVDHDCLLVLDSVVKSGEQQLKRLRNTLVTVKKIWEERIDYCIIKTRDDRPTYDVDVLFKNKKAYESAIKIACRSNCTFVREEPFKGWIPVENGIKIELHHGLSWFGMKVLDDNFILSNPRTIKLMDQVFQSVNEQAEFAIDFAHWIVDIQPLTLEGFLKLLENVEKEKLLQETMCQADKYGWLKQLEYHLSVLDRLCEYFYSRRLDLPTRLSNVRLTPRLPFSVPIHIKVPFLVKKTMRDNVEFGQRFKMLQLALRRYAWTRIWQ